MPHLNHDMIVGIIEHNLSHDTFTNSLLGNTQILIKLLDRADKYIRIEQSIGMSVQEK